MPKKIDPQVRVQKRDLEDLIRDEIYGAVRSSLSDDVLLILKKDVKKLAKKIATRAIKGH